MKNFFDAEWDEGALYWRTYILWGDDGSLWSNVVWLLYFTLPCMVRGHKWRDEPAFGSFPAHQECQHCWNLRDVE